MAAASFELETDDQGRHHVRLLGQWSLRSLENDFAELKDSLQPFFTDPFTHWDLRNVEQLDSAGASILWIGWGAKLDNRVALTEEQTKLFQMLGSLKTLASSKAPFDWLAPLIYLGGLSTAFCRHLTDFVKLIGLLLLELAYLIRRPQDFPWREFLANIYKSGVTALPVTAMLGFMIGVAMSYLMAAQLRAFGADIFIVNILGLSIIRELGPILMAILIAGRSGSAMTAQIGVMRVTE